MKFIFTSFFLILGKSAAKVPLSEFVPLCDIKDSNLNACVVKSANLMIPKMALGIKSYRFPPLDPLFVPKMDVGQSGGPINLKLELTNTTHYGLSTMKFHSASIDPQNKRWILNGTITDYSLQGRYKASGRILLVPLVGDGLSTFTFQNIGIDFVIKGAPKTEKNNDYFNINSLRIYFKFKKTHVSLTNLFGGNKKLGEVTNAFLNQNSDEVINGLKGTLEDVYSALYMNLVKKITSNVPYNQLFKNLDTQKFST